MSTLSFSKRYAHGTETSTSNTRAELERTLQRFGATGFGFVSQGMRAMIMFEAHGRRIRFDMPDPKEALQPWNRYPSTAQLEAEHKRLWRSMLMAIKAKLEIVQSGITSFESEFLSYTIMADGRTFMEASQSPEFVNALSAGNLPPMLPGGKP